jgi:hypothetical protein
MKSCLSTCWRKSYKWDANFVSDHSVESNNVRLLAFQTPSVTSISNCKREWRKIVNMVFILFDRDKRSWSRDEKDDKQSWENALHQITATNLMNVSKTEVFGNCKLHATDFAALNSRLFTICPTVYQDMSTCCRLGSNLNHRKMTCLFSDCI